ncbi:hypothetical protein [Peterkaempfera griseoplana]|uniref:hypothetical protein n=1 Tax=Peterkaempfera griseoplana TaxID=66896 RepID=UPI0006E1217F|nr:hypothetical protein [Peterkaempfera griseoplana]
MPGQEQERVAARDSGLRAALQGEAARHAPDREYILRRLEQAQLVDRYGAEVRNDGLRSPLRRSVRLSGAGAALGSLMLVGGAAAWVATAYQQDDRPSIRISDGPLAPPDAARPSPGAHHSGPTAHGGNPGASPRPHTSAPAAPPASTTSSAAGPSSPEPGSTDTFGGTSQPTAGGVVTVSTGAPQEDHFLRAQGSVDGHSTDVWTQSNIYVTTTVPLRTLQVEVRIARTDGAVRSGDWTELAPADLAETPEDSDSEIVYRFTLRQGVVLQPGTYLFASQFHHDAGDRDVSQDRYSVTASGQDGSAGSATVNGRFG